MHKNSKISKKSNNKTVNIIIIIGIIFLIASLVLMLSKNKKVENHIKEIGYDEYREIINKDEYSIVIITSPTCIHCQEYKPYVNYVANDHNLVIYDLNISELNYEQYILIHDSYKATQNSYSKDGSPVVLTPTTIITKNGSEVSSISGDIGYTGLVNLLKENEVIK